MHILGLTAELPDVTAVAPRVRVSVVHEQTGRLLGREILPADAHMDADDYRPPPSQDEHHNDSRQHSPDAEPITKDPSIVTASLTKHDAKSVTADIVLPRTTRAARTLWRAMPPGAKPGTESVVLSVPATWDETLLLPDAAALLSHDVVLLLEVLQVGIGLQQVEVPLAWGFLKLVPYISQRICLVPPQPCLHVPCPGTKAAEEASLTRATADPVLGLRPQVAAPAWGAERPNPTRALMHRAQHAARIRAGMPDDSLEQAVPDAGMGMAWRGSSAPDQAHLPGAADFDAPGRTGYAAVHEVKLYAWQQLPAWLRAWGSMATHPGLAHGAATELAQFPGWAASPRPAVWLQYKARKRQLLAATLGVQVALATGDWPAWHSDMQAAMYQPAQAEAQQASEERLRLRMLRSKLPADVPLGSPEEEEGKEAEQRAELRRMRRKLDPCLPPTTHFKSLPAGSFGAMAVEFSPNGKLLAVSCAGRGPGGATVSGGPDPSGSTPGLGFEIKLYDPDSGVLQAALVGHSGMIHALSWRHDSAYLASASADGTTRVWRVFAQNSFGASESAVFAPACVAICNLVPPVFVYDVAWHPTAAGALVTGSFDGQVRLWDVYDAVRESEQLPAASPVGTIVMSSSRRADAVLAALEDATSPASGAAAAPEVRFPAGAVLGRAWRCPQRDADLCAACGVTTPAPGAGPHAARVNTVAFEASGRRALSGDALGVIVQWSVDPEAASEVGSWAVLRRILSPRLLGSPVLCLAPRPRLRHVLALSATAGLVLLDTGSEHGAILRAYPGVRVSGRAMVSCGWSPDAQFTFCGSEDGELCIWRADSAVVVEGHGQTSGARSLYCLGYGASVLMPGVAWHPVQHMVALSAWGDAHPVMLWTAST